LIGPILRRCLAYRPKFTIGRLMIAVAVLAPFFAILRGDAAGSLLAGAIIVATCVVILAYKLTVDAIARNEANEKTIGWRRKVFIVLTSSAFAVAIIGLADFLFLIVYGSYGGLHSSNYGRSIELGALITGVAVTVFATMRLRRSIEKMREELARPRQPAGPPIEINIDEWT
jgi:hypothetical protein